MDLRLTFNDDASNYERLRPTYTDELFDDAIVFQALPEIKGVFIPVKKIQMGMC